MPTGTPAANCPRCQNGLKPMPDVAESPGGHLWDLARKNGLTYRNYGFMKMTAPARAMGKR